MSSAASSGPLAPVWLSGRRQPAPGQGDAGGADDLQRQVVKTLEREMKAIGAGVQQDIREELRRWLAEQPAPARAGPLPDLFSRKPLPLQEHSVEPSAMSKVEPLFVADLAAEGDARSNGKLRAGAQVRASSLPGMVDADSNGSPGSPGRPGRAPAAAGRVPKKPEELTNVSGPQHQPQTMVVASEGKPNRFAFCDESDSDQEGSAALSSTADTRKGRADEVAEVKPAFERPARRGRGSIVQGQYTSNSRSAANAIEEKLRGTKKVNFSTVWKKYKEDNEMPAFDTLCMCLVTSNYFDYCMGSVLLANAATIGVQANHFAGLASTGDKDIPLTFRVIDAAFCILFTTELTLRIIAFKLGFFKGAGWRWNWFDTMIVFFQILDELVKLFFTNSSIQDGLDKVGVIRMLRLARLMRLVRMVRLIPELKSMVYLIAASIGSFFWSLILILIMIYCYAIYYTEIATGMIQEGKIVGNEVDSAQALWGGVLHSTLSLWMAITGGDDWRNFSDLFQEDDAYAMHILFFVVYMAFATLVMLNLVTGVFVEGAQRILKEDKDAELLNMAAKIFEGMGENQDDINPDMEISFQDFAELCASGQMDEYIKAIGISPDDALHLYNLLDTDKTGTVTVSEFVNGCLRLRGNARSLDMAEMEWKMHSNFHKLSKSLEHVGAVLNSHINRNREAIKEMSAKGQADLAALRKLAEVDMSSFPIEEV